MQDEARKSLQDAGDAEGKPTEIGLILVHGIGEQGRFEHLDAHIRGVVAGFRRSGATVTVEIMSADNGTFQSAQDSWRGGSDASIRLFVRHGGEQTIVNVHEVWWADINEPYSVMKQVRFWLWGLSVWCHPRQILTGRPETANMEAPRLLKPGSWTEAWVRMRLFAIGCTFLIGSFTIGLLTVLATRLLNVKALLIIKTFVNYLSSVKLYNQSQRRGAGLGTNADFLDALGEPPRDSIRRRMIRTICDVACKDDYRRWYVLAHSLGSVVAFNGLMEPGRGWIGYLDEMRLVTLRRKEMVSMQQRDRGAMIPPRPLWSSDGEVVDRGKMFAKFAGMLTYGSPLEKFAAVWPARIPVFTEPAFKGVTSWVNIFDPTDSVSGVIHSWDHLSPALCPKVTNIGYRSHDLLLLGHIKYLECPYPLTGELYGERLADHVAPWLLGDPAAFAGIPARPRFFQPHGRRARDRGYSGLAQWAAAFVLLTALAAYFVPKYPMISTLPDATFFWWSGALLAFTVLTTLVFGIAFAPNFAKRPAPEDERV